MRKEKGITLISLIITIIILLILAGVSIALLTGENGIIKKAELAKQKSEEAEQNENIVLEDYENKIKQYTEGTRQNNNTTVLWEENPISSGTLELTDSIYNYDFLKVYIR